MIGHMTGVALCAWLYVLCTLSCNSPIAVKSYSYLNQKANLMTSHMINHMTVLVPSPQVYMWLSDVGNPFLSSSNGIGSDASGAQSLLKSHDQFEGNSHGTYSLASQLFARAKELSASGECNPDMIEEEAESLESAVSIFATRLDERREIILHSEDYHNKMKAVSEGVWIGSLSQH